MNRNELTAECSSRVQHAIEMLDQSSAACSFCFQGLIQMKDGHNECSRLNTHTLEEIKALSALLNEYLAQQA